MIQLMKRASRAYDYARRFALKKVPAALFVIKCLEYDPYTLMQDITSTIIDDENIFSFLKSHYDIRISKIFFKNLQIFMINQNSFILLAILYLKSHLNRGTHPIKNFMMLKRKTWNTCGIRLWMEALTRTWRDISKRISLLERRLISISTAKQNFSLTLVHCPLVNISTLAVEVNERKFGFIGTH